MNRRLANRREHERSLVRRSDVDGGPEATEGRQGQAPIGVAIAIVSRRRRQGASAPWPRGRWRDRDGVEEKARRRWPAVISCSYRAMRGQRHRRRRRSVARYQALRERRCAHRTRENVEGLHARSSSERHDGAVADAGRHREGQGGAACYDGRLRRITAAAPARLQRHRHR